jgi:alkylhydroperoxidase family enzyme
MSYPDYSDAERVAIEYAERFATDHTAIDQELFDRLARHFDPPEIMELSLSVACWLGLGRVNQVLGLELACPLVLDDG